MRNWNWTPRAYELWFMVKFVFYGLLITGLLVLADWVGRTWLH